MTSNFTHNDIMEYIGIGMNDILPKPFSKNTLYDILEKHCSHLKIIQQQQQLQQQQQQQQHPQTEQLMIPRLLDDNNLYTPASATSTTTSATTTPTTPNTTSPTQQHHTSNSDYWQPLDNSNRKLIWSSSSPASSSSSSSVHSQTPHNKRQKLHELYDNWNKVTRLFSNIFYERWNHQILRILFVIPTADGKYPRTPRWSRPTSCCFYAQWYYRQHEFWFCSIKDS